MRLQLEVGPLLEDDLYWGKYGKCHTRKSTLKIFLNEFCLIDVLCLNDSFEMVARYSYTIIEQKVSQERPG